MHPPLFRPHPDCSHSVEELVRCHNENPILKFGGVCNDVKIAMDLCFREEKIKKRTANLERARQFEIEFRKQVAEMNEENRQAVAIVSK